MDIDKIRNILNLFFMLLALLAVIFYFTMAQDQRFFLYTCGAAIIIKMAESFIRFISSSLKIWFTRNRR